MTTLNNINAYTFSSASSNNVGGKLYVPVNKTALLYSHFDHVSGVAAKQGQQGVSISKIKILNTLIDRLSSIKSEPKELFTEISDDQADVLIEAYQKQIKQTVAQAANKPYALAGAQPQAGILFAIDA